jgi:hypothetical protein
VASILLLYRVSWSAQNVRLPFTRDEFFDLFAAYNSALWPAVVGLWVASLLAAVWLLSSPRPRDRWLSGFLAAHWAWSAVAYHIAFFARINLAAWLFAAMGVVQAALFFWLGVVRGQLSFTSHRMTWSPIAWTLIGYALLYPAINAVQHASVARIPTFGLPCPTTILTGGLLLLASPRLRILAIVPVIWSAIGGSAALVLGVSADYALPITGIALTVFELQKSAREGAGSSEPKPVSEPADQLG